MTMLASKCCVYPVKATAAGLSILPTDSAYLNDNHFFYVVGEVLNAGDTAVTDVYVNATFYKSTGETVAEISQATELSTILPGRTSPFDITLMDHTESQQVYNYTLRIVQSSIAQNWQLGLMIISNSSSLDSNGFHINGVAKNIGTQSTSFTRVIATFYNLTGHAVGTVANESDPSFLDVNQTAPFEISLNSSAVSQVDHYALEAESYDSTSNAYDYELIPEFQPIIFLLTLVTSTLALAIIPRRIKKTPPR